MAQSAPSGKSPVTRGVAAVLLIVAVIGTLWVPIYARATPKLGVFPFFYWYQLILVPTVAILCWICYLLLRRPRPAQSGGHARADGAPHHTGGVRR
jgi:hypothetical protein